jgi:hypothetical protein
MTKRDAPTVTSAPEGSVDFPQNADDIRAVDAAPTPAAFQDPVLMGGAPDPDDHLAGPAVMVTRPAALPAHALKLDFNGVKYYVHLAFHGGRLVEMFVNTSRTSPTTRVLLDVVGRLVSTALKEGASARDICKHLAGQDDGQGAFYHLEGTEKPRYYTSIFDLLSHVLTRYETQLPALPQGVTLTERAPDPAPEVTAPALNILGTPLPVLTERPGPSYNPSCAQPGCDASNFRMEGGCPTCETCGFSKCM